MAVSDERVRVTLNLGARSSEIIVPLSLEEFEMRLTLLVARDQLLMRLPVIWVNADGEQEGRLLVNPRFIVKAREAGASGAQ